MRHASRIVLAAVLVLAALAYRPLLGLELLGWDSWPLVMTSRIRDFSELRGVLGDEMMQGRYPGGDFYRPVTSLAFAFDYAAWGIAPLGYHVTDLALLLATALALWALAKRLFGEGIGAVVAAFVHALSAVQLEVLPVSARRADALAILFLLLALLALPRPGARRAGARALLAGFLALLAAGAKETGVVVVPLAAALLAIETRGAGARAGAARVLRALAPVVVAVLAFLAARTLVLDGLGGHPLSTLAGLRRSASVAWHYVGAALLPEPLASGRVDEVVRTVLAVALVYRVAWRALPARDRAPLFLVAWLGVVSLITSIAGSARPWYALAFLPTIALAVGYVADSVPELWRTHRIGALANAAFVVVVLALVVRHSALVEPYESLRRLSDRERAFLAELRERIEAAAPGDSFEIEGMPNNERGPRSGAGVDNAFGLTDYSVRAWVRLALPHRSVQLRLPEGVDRRRGTKLRVTVRS